MHQLTEGWFSFFFYFFREGQKDYKCILSICESDLLVQAGKQAAHVINGELACMKATGNHRAVR